MAVRDGCDAGGEEDGVALDDISATEWRSSLKDLFSSSYPVALDDISATEWRTQDTPLFTFSHACCTR